MAELLILEFDGVDETDYATVNAQLGLDPQTGAGDWPAGLITHLTGLTEGGSAYVIEVWESRTPGGVHADSPRPGDGSWRSQRHSEGDLGPACGPSQPGPLNSHAKRLQNAENRHHPRRPGS